MQVDFSIYCSAGMPSRGNEWSQIRLSLIYENRIHFLGRGGDPYAGSRRVRADGQQAGEGAGFQCQGQRWEGLQPEVPDGEGSGFSLFREEGLRIESNCGQVVQSRVQGL